MKYLIKSVSVIILLTILITSVPIVSSAKTYSDVSSSHWAYNAIHDVTEDGLIVKKSPTVSPKPRLHPETTLQNRICVY